MVPPLMNTASLQEPLNLFGSKVSICRAGLEIMIMVMIWCS